MVDKHDYGYPTTGFKIRVGTYKIFQYAQVYLTRTKKVIRLLNPKLSNNYMSFKRFVKAE